MKFEETNLYDLTIQYDILNEVMTATGFYPTYDYERVTFDYKMLDQVKDRVYYFRVQATAVEGEIPSPRCKVKLLKPILGRHYFPHGIEYDEDFPETIINRCNKKIDEIKVALQEENIAL